VPRLQLDLPWASAQELGSLRVERGRRSVLSYEDGVTLAVRVLDPAQFESAAELAAAAKAREEPGNAVLVAGAVPLDWRSRLRDERISYVDVSGVASLSWPRLEITTGQFARDVQRRRAPLPMQKGHAVVVQALLVAHFRKEPLTNGALAELAGVSPATASKATAQLQAHGLLEKEPDGASVIIEVTRPEELADLLAARTAWPHGASVLGYRWGANAWDLARRLTEAADAAKLEFALTGRGALPFLGILSTASPNQLRCWVRATDDALPEIAGRLRLEPVAAEDANVAIAADRWGIGLNERRRRSYDGRKAWIAHPLRVWCDVHAEPRGSEFAAQLWPEIARDG